MATRHHKNRLSWSRGSGAGLGWVGNIGNQLMGDLQASCTSDPYIGSLFHGVGLILPPSATKKVRPLDKKVEVCVKWPGKGTAGAGTLSSGRSGTEVYVLNMTSSMERTTCCWTTPTGPRRSR